MKISKCSTKKLIILCAVLFVCYFSSLIGFKLLVLKSYNDLNAAEHTHTSLCYAERSGSIYIDNAEYVLSQYTDVKIPETVTAKKFLGYLTDFEGFYSICPSKSGDGGVYTIKEDDNILVVYHSEYTGITQQYYVPAPEGWK